MEPIYKNKSELTSKEVLNLRVKILSQKLKDLFRKIADSKNAVENSKNIKILEDFKKELRDIKAMMDDTVKEIFSSKYPRDLRTEALDILGSAKELLNSVTDLLNAAFIGKIDNQMIAKVKTLAYKNNLKASLKRKLEVRAQFNVKKFNKYNVVLEKYLSSLNKEEL